MSREALLVRTLVELAEGVVDDFDVVELLTKVARRSIELLDIAAAGVMLGAGDGELHLVASSDEAMRVVELFELQTQEGPCPDCYRTGEAVPEVDLTADAGRWPTFGPVALEAGFRWVQALPLRLRGNVIGVLNLFGDAPTGDRQSAAVVARALADVATIAIVQQRAAREAQVLNEQLTQALNSRVVIEQAKGVLAERAGINVDEAFNHLRRYARSRNLRLADVARSLLDGRLGAAELNRVAGAARPRPR